ncbi:programmed cell death protein 2 [Cercophora samala]|uniref:Programmed cell death protein 2 n=1 Tax=Cercophora samala TaxID=330535 RepID=A0AA39Z1K1_9PEZI|nr:programmed cell death protein 2 [Cercophora samala]
MAPYDSDSSGAEDDDFQETNVLLGYASEDAQGEEISRLGGQPAWLDPSKPPSAALARCKVCKDLMVLLLQLNAELPDRYPGHERRLYVFSCRRKSCRRKEGSIRAIRGLRVSPDAVQAAKEAKETTKPREAPVVPKASTLGLGEALFGAAKPAGSSSLGGGGNPFASGSSTTAPPLNPFAPRPTTTTTTTTTGTTTSANPFAAAAAPASSTPAAPEPKPAVEVTEEEKLPKSFAETLSLNLPPAAPQPAAPEPWPTTSDSLLPKAYPVRWIAEADYEQLDPEPAPISQKTQMMDIDSPEPGSSSASSGGGGGKEDKEVFESSMDTVFQKFADRVGQNPEQVIRYEFAGQPLLYSKSDAVGKMLYAKEGGEEKVKTGKGGMPRCGNCGGGRVFEVQMTPQAIQELEGEEEDLDGMDWGTVIVGVCERDCQQRGVEEGEGGYLEEWAGVQWEELHVKR